jgi:prolyl oligopeptidase
MKHAFIILICLAACLSSAQNADTQQTQGPPPTRTDMVQEVLHGVPVADPYRWLEDQNSPETRTWITAQNAYTHSLLDGWPGRDGLEKRLSELKKVESIRSPFERNGRFFYRRPVRLILNVAPRAGRVD